MRTGSAPWRGRDYIFGLQAFVTVHDREFHALAFDEYSVAFTANGAEMDEDIVT
ncbi:hypothetical protein D3C86_1964560 [compost metagenome]